MVKSSSRQAAGAPFPPTASSASLAAFTSPLSLAPSHTSPQTTALTQEVAVDQRVHVLSLLNGKLPAKYIDFKYFAGH